MTRDHAPTSRPTPHSGTTVRVGADRCAWAILSDLPANASPPAVAAAAEPFLPFPLDRAEMRAVRIGRTVVVCAMERDELDAIIAGGTPTPRSVHPESLPTAVTDALGDSPPPPSALFEFRTGALEPPSHRRRRQLAYAALAIGILATSAVLTHRWREHGDSMRQDAAALRLQTDARLRGALPPPYDRATAIDPRLRLASELNRLRRTRAAPAGVDGFDGDVIAPWQSLLGAWPSGPRIAVERIVLTPQRLTIDGRAADIDSAERLRAALDAFHPGWARIAYRYADPRGDAQPFLFEFAVADPATTERSVGAPGDRSGASPPSLANQGAAAP
ncbi:MAG: hypothetical protein ACTS3F_02485 [Phycisphaerales bacterium]